MTGPPLDGLVALVTGANHGIGAATAIEMARLGADVAATYLRLDLPEHEVGRPPRYATARRQDCSETSRAITELGRRCVPIEADLADPAAAAWVFDRAEAELGPVSILVNNASGWRKDTFSASLSDRLGRPDQPVTAESIDAQYLVDARGGALMIAELARRHRARDATWGRVISLTSGGPGGFAGEVSYGAAKAALENFTMSASTELAPVGITANVVYPPVTDTGWITPEVRRLVAESADLHRVADPIEVARVIAWLCTETADLVTGNVIRLR